jgi:hypothetical protein
LWSDHALVLILDLSWIYPGFIRVFLRDFLQNISVEIYFCGIARQMICLLPACVVFLRLRFPGVFLIANYFFSASIFIGKTPDFSFTLSAMRAPLTQPKMISHKQLPNKYSK